MFFLTKQIKFTKFAKKKTKSLFFSSIKPSQNHYNSEYLNRENFDLIYEKIKDARREKDAPVDYFGSEACVEQGGGKEAENFQRLIALIISVQNRDKSTAEAMDKMKKNGLSLEQINEMDEESIKNMIGNVNYKNKKAKFIKQAASIIKNKYDSVIPTKLEELLEFPGIGYKIAVLYLNDTLQDNIGIGVDTHVHRIANRLGWVNTKEDRNKTRTELESFIPKEKWRELNGLLVGFGQQICLPIQPKCHSCPLKFLCPIPK